MFKEVLTTYPRTTEPPPVMSGVDVGQRHGPEVTVQAGTRPAGGAPPPLVVAVTPR